MMDQRAAFDATVELAEAKGMPRFLGGSISLNHLFDMQSRITDDFSDAKLGRWLGWAQAALVAANVGVTLEDMKQLNLSHVTAPASSPAEQNDEAERERIADVLTSYDIGPGMQRLNRPTALSLADAILAVRSSPAATTREWEYRAVACEPDTGDIYETTNVVKSAGEAVEAATQYDLLYPSPDLPQLVLAIQRRTPAGPWVAVPKGDE